MKTKINNKSIIKVTLKVEEIDENNEANIVYNKESLLSHGNVSIFIPDMKLPKILREKDMKTEGMQKIEILGFVIVTNDLEE